MCDETEDLESRYHVVIEQMGQMEKEGKHFTTEGKLSAEYSALTDELNGILDVLDPAPEEEE